MPIGGTSSPERTLDSVEADNAKKSIFLRSLSKRSLRGLNGEEYLNGPRDDRGWTPLLVACKSGDVKEVARLLDSGADANEVSRGPKAPGATPLHLAASGGWIEVMDLLLEHGANIEAKTKGACGWTPLHHAAKEKNRKAIRFLLECGAFLSPDICDPRFNPPLHYCPGLEYAYKFSRRMQTSA